MNPYSGSILKDKSEVEFVLNNISSDTVMLEWGCGAGTLLFSAYVKQYYSIEHNREWYEKISNENRPNLKVFFSPTQDNNPDKFLEDKTSPWKDVLNTKYANRYKQYIECFDKIEGPIDIILIDGRARTACAKYILNKITINSTIIIHDWNREHYKRVLKSYRVIKESSDFSGMVSLKKSYDLDAMEFLK